LAINTQAREKQNGDMRKEPKRAMGKEKNVFKYI
jgi:hypothetical protein